VTEDMNLKLKWKWIFTDHHTT